MLLFSSLVEMILATASAKILNMIATGGSGEVAVQHCENDMEKLTCIDH